MKIGVCIFYQKILHFLFLNFFLTRLVSTYSSALTGHTFNGPLINAITLLT